MVSRLSILTLEITYNKHFLKFIFMMISLTKNVDKNLIRNVEKQLVFHYSDLRETKQNVNDEFRVLNLRHVKGRVQQRQQPKKMPVLPSRTKQMALNQDWGSVWPGPRTFHPATVPIPIRQGYVEKGAAPDKYANAELMKIPNFLHLTPPVIKRQCEALKKFCTPWPKGLDTDEKCEKHFPIEVTSTDYLHSSPSIRNSLARIITVRVKVSALQLNARARDKLLRLVGDRYNDNDDTLTIVTDRCPLRKQNYDYAMYLLTACFHESWNIEPWEEMKSEADMEYYDWNKNASKKNIEALFAKPAEEIPNVDEYSKSVDNLMNEGESEYTVTKYGEAVRKLLGLPMS